MKLYKFDTSGVFLDEVEVENSVFIPPGHTRQPLPYQAPNGYVWVMRNGWKLESAGLPRPSVVDYGDTQQLFIDLAQKRLDDFARTRNYDGILSLCTYATSVIPKFKLEGQYGVEVRDATWAKLYTILTEVEAGVRPVPGSFSDIEPELPALAWPV